MNTQVLWYPPIAIALGLLYALLYRVTKREEFLEMANPVALLFWPLVLLGIVLYHLALVVGWCFHKLAGDLPKRPQPDDLKSSNPVFERHLKLIK